MVTLRRLLPDETSLLSQVMSGYSCEQRYRVERHESDVQTLFSLTLEDLPLPYIKDFRGEVTPAELQEYRQIAAEGLSIGAWDGDQPVGMGIASAQEWNRTLWIWEFHILPAYHHQGVGRQMMESLAENGRAAGMRTMRVETQNTNVPAIRFYRAVGFHTEGVDVSFYSNDDIVSGEVAIFMKRRLT